MFLIIKEVIDMPLPRTLRAGFKKRGREKSAFEAPAKPMRDEWLAEHAEEVETERLGREQLRAGVLDFLGVTEEQLIGNYGVRKRILSDAVLDEQGEPYPDIVIAAGRGYISLSVYDRLDTSSSKPWGWTLKHVDERYGSSYLNEALGTQITTNRYMPIHSVPEISADMAASHLSDALEYAASHPQAYDLEGAATQIIPPARQG